METPKQNFETNPARPTETLPGPDAETYPIGDTSSATMDPSINTKPAPYETGLIYEQHHVGMLDQAQKIGKSALVTSKDLFQSVWSKIHDSGERGNNHNSKQARIIAAGSVVATGIGLVIKKRHHDSKKSPENLTGKAKGKAKDLLPSR